MEELSETKTSRGRLSLRTVLRTRLLFGMYCPVHQRTAMRIFAWLYCFCLAFSVSTGIINIMNDRGAPLIFVMPLIIDYNANVLISLLTGEEHIFNFLKRVQLTDAEIGYNRLPLMSRAAQYIYLIILVEKALIWIGSIVQGLNSYIFTTITSIVAFGLSINFLTTVLPLDLLRIRIRLLRQGLEATLSPSSVNNTDDQIAILWGTFKQYRNLIDSLSNSFGWQKIRISIGVCCCLTSFLANGSLLVYDIKIFISHNEASYCTAVPVGTNKFICRPKDFGLTSPHLTARHVGSFVFTCIPTCLPAVFSELVSREVDQLKTALGNQLVACEDERLLSELDYAAQYLELRPFSLRLYRACAYDGSFVLAFVGLCITYLIVIIQFFGII